MAVTSCNVTSFQVEDVQGTDRACFYLRTVGGIDRPFSCYTRPPRSDTVVLQSACFRVGSAFSFNNGVRRNASLAVLKSAKQDSGLGCYVHVHHEHFTSKCLGTNVHVLNGA